MSANDVANKQFICGFAKEKLYLLFILAKHQANPQSTWCIKNESGLCRALDFKRQLIQDSRCLAGTSYQNKQSLTWGYCPYKRAISKAITTIKSTFFISAWTVVMTCAICPKVHYKNWIPEILIIGMVF